MTSNGAEIFQTESAEFNLTLPEWTRKGAAWILGVAVAAIAVVAIVLASESPEPKPVIQPEDAYMQHGGIDPARGWGVCNKVAQTGISGEALTTWVKWEYTVSRERAALIVELSHEYLCPGTFPTLNS